MVVEDDGVDGDRVVEVMVSVVDGLGALGCFVGDGLEETALAV